jgi:hypothetical protein
VVENVGQQFSDNQISTQKVIYVSKLGDNSDGSSWEKAFHTIQVALSAVPAEISDFLKKNAVPYSLEVQHFPDRLHTFIWRNWYLIPSDRLAKVVGTSEDNIRQIAFSMGLPQQPQISEAQLSRSYITVIKRNWHLLPFDQLLELLDWTPEKLDFILKEDDFLFIKLGSAKPECDPITYNPPDAKSQKTEKYIANLLNEEFPEGLELPGENLFDFIHAFDFVKGTLPANQSSSRQKIRFCYSYYALYGDPLADTLLNPYPDGYLLQLAASGINGIWLPALLSKLTPFPWDTQLSSNYQLRLKNLGTLVKRAKRFGIGVYLYLNEPRSMPLSFFEKYPDLKGTEEGQFAALCTSNPEIRNYLSDAIASICKTVPDIAGFLTITASENLTNCWSHGNGNNCPQCSKRDPAEVITEVNRAFFLGIERALVNPGGKHFNINTRPRLIVWDWGWKDAWIKKIISKLPKGVSLMSVSEWGIPIERGGIKSSINEYCLSAIGPGEKAKQEWKWVRNNKLGIFAKIQANSTWELSSVPYLPVVENVALQAKNLNKEEVDGIMAGWTLGGYPSPNLLVLKEISDNPDITPEEGMLRVAQRRYGMEAAPLVVNAWIRFSRAFNKFPFHQSVVYHAPLQTGPANLLWPNRTGYKSSMVGFPYDDIDGWRGPYPVQTFINQLDSVAIGFDDAISELQDKTVIPELSPDARKALNDDINFVTVASIHYRSVANQARFVDLRNKLKKINNPDSAGEILKVLKKTLNDEINLAKRLYYIQSHDSRIGFEASNQYYYIPVDLVEKVINCRYLMDFWLPEMKQTFSPEPENRFVACWNFNEGRGSLAEEASEKDLKGIIHNAKWTEGICKNALEFSEEDTYVDCSNNNVLNFSNALTVEVWMKPDAWVFEDYGIVGKHSDDKNSGWAIQYNGYANLLQFWININNRTEILTAATPLPDAWHYIAGTYNGKQISLYIDGISKATRQVTGKIDTCANKLIIGKLFENRPGYSFRGAIDEVRITNGSLSESEIRTNFHNRGGIIKETRKVPAVITTNYPHSLFVPDAREKRNENPGWYYNIRSFTWRGIPPQITPEKADSIVKEFSSYGINTIFPEGYRYLFGNNGDSSNYFKSLPFEEYIHNLKIISEACHKNGIRLIGHLTACCVLESYFNEHQYQTMIDIKTGAKAYFRRYGTYMMCPNNPDFQNIFLERVKRMVNETGMDGLMVDETEWLPAEWTICGCKYCSEKFIKETGYDIPNPDSTVVWGNFENPQWRAWINFRIESMGDFLVKVKETLDQCGHGKLFTGCYCEALYPGVAQYYGMDLEDMQRSFNTSFFESEPSNPWSWRYDAAEAKYYAAFGPCIYLGYSASYTQQFFSWAFAKTNGFGLWIWPEVEKRFPYQWEKKWEDLLSSHEVLCNTALLFSSPTKNLKEDSFYSIYEYVGWAESLIEAHIPFETIIASGLDRENIKKYKKIILPDAACLSDSQTDILQDYVREGGHLVITGSSSLYDEKGERRKDFSLNEIMGLSFKEYIPSIDSLSMIPGELAGVAGEDILYNGSGVMVDKVKNDITMLARIKRTVSPAITLSKYGKGDVIYVAFRPGIMYYMPKIGGGRMGEGGSWNETRMSEYKNLIVALSTQKIFLPLYTENIPSEIIVNAFTHNYKGYSGILIHMLNCLGTKFDKNITVPPDISFEFLDYPSLNKIIDKGKLMKIKVMANDIKRAYLISPDFNQVVSLDSKITNEYCEIKIPDIGRYQVIYLVKGDRDIVKDITKGKSIVKDFPGVVPFESANDFTK